MAHYLVSKARSSPHIAGLHSICRPSSLCQPLEGAVVEGTTEGRHSWVGPGVIGGGVGSLNAPVGSNSSLGQAGEWRLGGDFVRYFLDFLRDAYEKGMCT
jgi:hypothetical protein